MDNDGMVLSQNLCFLVAESLYQWPLVLRPLLAAVSYLPINPIVNMLNNAVAVVEFRKNNPEAKRPDLLQCMLEAKVASINQNGKD